MRLRPSCPAYAVSLHFRLTVGVSERLQQASWGGETQGLRLHFFLVPEVLDTHSEWKGKMLSKIGGSSQCLFE